MSNITKEERDRAIKNINDKGGIYLNQLAEKFKADKDVVMAAVKNYAPALEYASPQLKGNKDVVMAAVNKDFFAIKFASPQLKRDNVIVKFVIETHSSDPDVLRYFPNEVQNNKGIVEAAVKINGLALQYASPQLKGDKDVVMAAVNNNGYALIFADYGLHSDPDILIKAVNKVNDVEQEVILKTVVESITKNNALKKNNKLLEAIYHKDPDAGYVTRIAVWPPARAGEDIGKYVLFEDAEGEDGGPARGGGKKKEKCKDDHLLYILFSVILMASVFTGGLIGGKRKRKYML